MNTDLYAKLRDVCEKVKLSKIKRMYIYPYGFRGMYVCDFFLRMTDLSIVCVDDKVCNDKHDVISFDAMIYELNASREAVVLISSDNPTIYNELRIKVRANVNEEQIIDIYPRNPYIASSDYRLSSLAVIAEIINNKKIDGDVAEAGVFKGDFAKYINQLFPNKTCYLFDTFEGFEKKQINYLEDNSDQTRYWIDGLKDTSEEVVMSKMHYPDKIIIKKGMFPITAEGIDSKFSFVNLDMDIYEPTLAGLEFFWDKMSAGGVIFVHDYGNWEGITKAVDEFSFKYKVGFIPLNDGVTVAFVKGI